MLPARIRKILGMKEGGQVTIRVDGNRVILEPVSSNISEKVRKWFKLAMSIKAQALVILFLKVINLRDGYSMSRY